MLVGSQPSWSAKDAFQIIKENFAIASALTVLFGIVCATVFLYGYLVVFDWRLFWIIQYQDVLTFALIAVGVIGGVGGVLQGVIAAVFYSGVLESKLNLKIIAATVGIFIVLLGTSVFAEYRQPTPHYFHIIYVASCYITVFFFTYSVASHVNAGTFPNPSQAAVLALSVILSCYTFGQTLGYIVLETRQPDSEISLRGKSTLKARLILMTSHHHIFLNDKTIVVTPIEEIIQVRTPTN